MQGTYYPAKVGERVKNVNVVVSAVDRLDSKYGTAHIYEFVDNDYCFLWVTKKRINISTGDKVSITGTIKKFTSYNGFRQTQLSRCLIKEPI